MTRATRRRLAVCAGMARNERCAALNRARDECAKPAHVPAAPLFPQSHLLVYLLQVNIYRFLVSDSIDTETFTARREDGAELLTSNTLDGAHPMET